jgi:hypothetical protein
MSDERPKTGREPWDTSGSVPPPPASEPAPADEPPPDTPPADEAVDETPAAPEAPEEPEEPVEDEAPSWSASGAGAAHEYEPEPAAPADAAGDEAPSWSASGAGAAHEYEPDPAVEAEPETPAYEEPPAPPPIEAEAPVTPAVDYATELRAYGEEVRAIAIRLNSTRGAAAGTSFETRYEAVISRGCATLVGLAGELQDAADEMAPG